MGDIGDRIGGFVAAIIALATLAIVISSRANTVNVIRAFFAGSSNLIGVAISPITGANVAGLDASGLTGGQWASGASGTVLGGSYLGSAGGGVSVGLPSGAGFSLGGGFLQAASGILGGAGGLFGGGAGEIGSFD